MIVPMATWPCQIGTRASSRLLSLKCACLFSVYCSFVRLPQPTASEANQQHGFQGTFLLLHCACSFRDKADKVIVLSNLFSRTTYETVKCFQPYFLHILGALDDAVGTPSNQVLESSSMYVGDQMYHWFEVPGSTPAEHPCTKLCSRRDSEVWP